MEVYAEYIVYTLKAMIERHIGSGQELKEFFLRNGLEQCVQEEFYNGYKAGIKAALKMISILESEMDIYKDRVKDL